MRNLAKVMRQDCDPISSCVGPLVGSYLFSEAALTPTYRPFATYPYATRSTAQNAPSLGHLVESS